MARRCKRHTVSICGCAQQPADGTNHEAPAPARTQVGQRGPASRKVRVMCVLRYAPFGGTAVHHAFPPRAMCRALPPLAAASPTSITGRVAGFRRRPRGGTTRLQRATPRCERCGIALPQPPRRIVSAEEATGDYRRADGYLRPMKVCCRVLYGLYSFGQYSYEVHIVMA